HIFFFSLIPRPSFSTLFPYTTLFRSQVVAVLQCESVRPFGQPIECNLALRVHCFPDDLPDKSIAFAHDGFDESRSKAIDLSGRSDRKSTRLNSSHDQISYAVFCLKKK